MEDEEKYNIYRGLLNLFGRGTKTCLVITKFPHKLVLPHLGGSNELNWGKWILNYKSTW